MGATDPNALFDLGSFMKSRDKAHHKFYQLLMKTQMFIRFIEECSFVSDGDQGLAFFDECSEKFDADSDAMDIQFLEWASTSSSDRTKFILPPGDCHPMTPTPGYVYTRFELNPLLLKQHSRQKQHKTHVSNFLANMSATGVANGTGSTPNAAPGSPLARRTKHEIKAAHKMARLSQQRPESWANYLLGTCYSLYFLVLPSMLGKREDDSSNHVPDRRDVEQLKFAFDLLEKAAKFRIHCDEVCYRVMMQLCGIHNQPLLAVRLNYLMKRSGVQQNAITYGFYNRCVLEATWPQDAGGASQLRWRRVKNVVKTVAEFKRRGREYAEKRRRGISVSQENNIGGLDVDVGTSRTSLESQEPQEVGSALSFFNDGGALQKIRDRLGGIVKQTTGSVSVVSVDESMGSSAAGLLIAGDAKGNASLDQVKPSRESCDLSPRLVARSDSFGGDTKLMDKVQRQQSINAEKGRRSLFTDVNDDEDDEEEEDEGAGDAQLTNGSNGVRTTSSQESMSEKDETASPNTCSSRTLVTQDDPLGALNDDQEPTVKENPVTPEVLTKGGHEEEDKKHLFTDQPILFRGHRSQTFDESMTNTSKSMHRSETMPGNSVTSSLASSIKFFG